MCSKSDSEKSERSTRIVANGTYETGEPLGVAIPRAVGDATGSDPLEGKPLQQYIDVDALESLFRNGSSDVTVSFTYEDVHVTVRADGTIDVRP